MLGRREDLAERHALAARGAAVDAHAEEREGELAVVVSVLVPVVLLAVVVKIVLVLVVVEVVVVVVVEVVVVVTCSGGHGR